MQCASIHYLAVKTRLRAPHWGMYKHALKLLTKYTQKREKEMQLYSFIPRVTYELLPAP